MMVVKPEQAETAEMLAEAIGESLAHEGGAYISCRQATGRVPHRIQRSNLLLDGGELMRTHGEGGLEKIGHIWYFTFYNLNGKQTRRSSKSPLKSVAIEMLQKAQEELRKGTEPAITRKLYYEDLRQILLDDLQGQGQVGHG